MCLRHKWSFFFFFPSSGNFFNNHTGGHRRVWVSVGQIKLQGLFQYQNVPVLSLAAELLLRYMSLVVQEGVLPVLGKSWLTVIQSSWDLGRKRALLHNSYKTFMDTSVNGQWWMASGNMGLQFSWKGSNWHSTPVRTAFYFGNSNKCFWFFGPRPSRYIYWLDNWNKMTLASKGIVQLGGFFFFSKPRSQNHQFILSSKQAEYNIYPDMDL